MDAIQYLSTFLTSYIVEVLRDIDLLQCCVEIIISCSQIALGFPFHKITTPKTGILFMSFIVNNDRKIKSVYSKTSMRRGIMVM